MEIAATGHMIVKIGMAAGLAPMTAVLATIGAMAGPQTGPTTGQATQQTTQPTTEATLSTAETATRHHMGEGCADLESYGRSAQCACTSHFTRTACCRYDGREGYGYETRDPYARWAAMCPHQCCMHAVILSHLTCPGR